MDTNVTIMVTQLEGPSLEEELLRGRLTITCHISSYVLVLHQCIFILGANRKEIVSYMQDKVKPGEQTVLDYEKIISWCYDLASACAFLGKCI